MSICNFCHGSGNLFAMHPDNITKKMKPTWITCPGCSGCGVPFPDGPAEIRLNNRVVSSPVSTEISMKEFPDGQTMAHVCVKLGLFPSVGQAKKNGWDKPITSGDFKVGKRKFRIIEG